MDRLLICLLLLISTNAYSLNLTAKSWLVTDEHGVVLASENPDKVRTIASITKLLTSIVVLESNVNLDDKVDTKPFGSISRRELMTMAMVRSNNTAADLLCRTYPSGYKSCISNMNSKLQTLGMGKSKVYDSTGLDRRNVSTANELILLVQEAEKHAELIDITQNAEIEIKIKRKWFVFKNTNPLIGNTHDIQVSKTGWTRKAGGCIVMSMNTDKGKRIVVVLGSKSPRTRIPEAEFISQI